MRGKRGIFIAFLLLFLAACADHGMSPVLNTDGKDQGGIAFSLLKSETPADAWVIEARLEREGFPTLRQSVSVRTSSDTIRIIMNGIAAGYWKVTVEAKDSTGSVRYTGSSSVQIIEGQTAQATVQMNPSGGTGKLEIIVAWPVAASHMLIRTAGTYFFMNQIVPVSVTNVSGEVIIPSTCCTRPDLRIQQKVNGTWTPPGVCELMCPTIIHPMKPGERIVDSVIQISKPGVYRLMLRYMTASSAGNARQYEAYSNEFNVIGDRRDSVKLGEEFVLRLGERVTLRGTDLTLEFQDVTEDSRCPDGAVCVWAGNGRIQLGVNQSTVKLNTTLEPKQFIFGIYAIRLNSLSPYPMIERRIRKEEYVAALVVTPALTIDAR
jgi:hypothetical protein